MNHLDKIAALLPEYQLDAMVITSSPGEFYALGFHGEGVVLVTREGAQYSTDGRYIEAAQAQLRGVRLVQFRPDYRHLDIAAEAIRAQGLKRVGFESGYVSWDSLQRYRQKLPCTLVPAQKILSTLRASKDEEELSAMREAQRITDETFQAILDFIRPGMTEREIAARLVYELLRRGGERVSFDPIVATGANGSKPHAVPGDAVVEPGSFLTMDFGCVWGGYCSDMTRTVAVGRPTEEMERVYDIVLRAQLAGIAAAHGGVRGRAVDAAARELIAQEGYGPYFSHGFGHSLGIEIHEAPNASQTEEGVLPTGAVVSAEPGIYLPGRFGVRIEDVMVLREDHAEVLTGSPKNLIIL